MAKTKYLGSEMNTLKDTADDTEVRGMRVADIRPDEVMAGQEAAMMEDIAWLKERHDQFESVNCPACGADKYTHLYEKWGLEHVLCRHCQTQYANPRPPANLLAEFYRESKNYAYWAKYVFSASRDVRLERIFKPRAKILADTLEKRGRRGGLLLEVGAAYGLFCEAVRETGQFDTIVALEPTPKLAQICRDLGFETLESSYEDACPPKADAIAVFEVIEHLHDPSQFLRWCYENLNSGGCLFLTCPNIHGLETLALGREAGSVDHEHINLFHPESLKLLAEKCGFVDVDITTPGQLDFDLVRQAVEESRVSEDDIGPFLSHLVKSADEEVSARFQKFIRESRLSSHMMMMGFKS